MKKYFKLSFLVLSAIVLLAMTSCSDTDDQPENSVEKTIGFKDAPDNLFGSSPYGENLYNGTISKGYIVQLSGDTYAQFPINYGYNYDAEFQLAWCYTLYNGGFALSKYHDMTGDTYTNQLSVYDTESPSGSNFIIANGSSLITNPSSGKYSDYAGCAHLYITDSHGYGVANVGEESSVTGEDKDANFKSVMINNTTYTYLTMLNGNDYCSALNEENEGWFKVQFIAFDDDDPDEAPIGYTEVYLANFKKGQADGYIGIIEEWIKVDLSVLPECSILVVNFVGSDTSEWGLNTPAYCALDNFVIEVEK
ncbi:MAG: DUF4465 domain-containing protein [Muribaculaceae bacterium]|nr:DUF4465 domain-containing protein [Muribaculaceae bacterium]